MNFPRYTTDLAPVADSQTGYANGDGAEVSLQSTRARLNSTRNNAASGAVLLIVRDSEIRGLLRYGLEKEGFNLLEAGTGSEGIEIATKSQPCSIVLDMDVLHPNGVAVMKTLRESTQIPILALAGRVHRMRSADVLDQGASDFIGRPFDIEELSARLRAAQRHALPPQPQFFRSGSLVVDLTRRVVMVGEKFVKLTATEYSLLYLFIRHAGMVLTHAQILREIWGSEMLDKTSYLRVYLLALRKKLANPPEPNLFVTEQGIGYRLVMRDS